ncbi:MAG: CPBP family intramembrane metalloprotease [Clostridia bacterium]|nr:CPBP family intramembrane metalloprotease [Clostridia bacterium]
MRRAISYVVFADIIFILLLCVAGMTEGALSDAAYLCAFLLPASIVLLISFKRKRVLAPPKLKLSPRAIPLLLPTVMPTVFLVLLLSAAFSLLLSLFVTIPATDVSGNIWAVIFRHAVLTAVLEELLFRYLPITLLAPYSKRITVFLSALLFALSHAALYQIPYAFAAGVIFAVLDLAFDSILPSVILHFLNNLASVFWVRYFDNVTFRISYVALLCALTAASVVIMILLRKKYTELVRRATESGEKEKMPYEVWVFSLMMLIVSAMNL